jgi:mannose-6-phosphate isomerase-like protein (cupin superfamily)
VKRHPALVPLSHDHHHGLVAAKRLRAGAEDTDPAAAVRQFLRFFDEETARHFTQEEELLFPLLADSEEAREPLVRVLLEHQRVRARVAELRSQVEAGAPVPERMVELSDDLETHIRYEERQLFPVIERLFPELAALPDARSLGGHGPVWGLESEDLNATLLEWAAGQGTPSHVNKERDVLVVVLAGSAELTIGARTETLGDGEALIIPKGERRRITAGCGGARYVSAHRRRPPLQIASADRRSSA